MRSSRHRGLMSLLTLTYGRALNAIRALALSLPLGVALLGVVGGCHDKGTDPAPVKYSVYVGATTWIDDKQTDLIYVLDADSLGIHDSIPQPHYVDELAVSPDGRSMYVMEYVTPGDEDTLRKIDIRTRATVWARWHPLVPGKGYGGPLFLLDEGRLLFFDQELIQTSDGALIRELEDSVWAGTGPIAGTEIACWTLDSSNGGPFAESVVRAIDLKNGVFRGWYRPRLSSGFVLHTIRACLHPDGHRVCCAGAYHSSQNVWFVVGDLETGETLFEYQLMRGRGDIVITADGSKAVEGDHPVPGMLEGGRALDIFDLNDLTLLKKFEGIECSQLRLVDGGRHLITAPSSGFASSGAMFVIDMQALTIEREIRSIPYVFGGMDIGPALDNDL